MGPIETYWADGHRVRALSPGMAREECEREHGYSPVTVRLWAPSDDRRP